MPETKTFNHPLGLSSYFSDYKHKWAEDQPEQYEIYTVDSGYQQFPLDEWDIEVTFTRKPEPLKPDMWATVQYVHAPTEVVWIRAIVGTHAWVVDDPADTGLTGWIEPLDKLSA